MSQIVPTVAVLGAGKTALTIGYRVLNLDGTTYAAFSTTGVAETSVLGTYRVAGGVVVPQAGGYVVFGESGTDYAEATVDASGGGLTAQETADAVYNLAPDGSPAAGSLGAQVEAILEDTAAIDSTAITYVTSNETGVLTVINGATFNATLSGLTIAADWDTATLVCKHKAEQATNKADIAITVTNGGDAGDGLTTLAGTTIASPIAKTDGSLSLNQGAGTAVIMLTDEASALLGKYSGGIWYLRVTDDSGDTAQIAAGSYNVALV